MTYRLSPVLANEPVTRLAKFVALHGISRAAVSGPVELTAA